MSKEAMKLATDAREALTKMRLYGNTFCYRSNEKNPYEQVCEAIAALEALAEQPTQQEPWCMKMNGCTTKCEDCPVEVLPAQQEPVKLWLWKNFVNGKPEYWAFNNPFPCLTVNGDPLTFGEPCGWAIFKPSVNGRPERSEQEVVNTVTRLTATSPPAQRKPLTADEIQECWYRTQGDAERFARAIEAKL